MNRPLKKYESWLDVVERHYSIDQEVNTVYEQWVKLVDSETSIRLNKSDKRTICRCTIRAILHETISKNAPYAIGCGRFGYEFKLKYHEFISLLPLTVAVLLHQDDDHDLYPYGYLRDNDDPWSVARLMEENNLTEYEFTEKAADLLDILDMDIQIQKILYS